MFFAKVKQASVQCIVYFVQSIYAPPFENSSKCCCAMQNFALFRSQKHSEQILLARQSGLSFMNRNLLRLEKYSVGVQVTNNYNSLCCILLKLSPLGLKKTIPILKRILTLYITGCFECIAYWVMNVSLSRCIIQLKNNLPADFTPFTVERVLVNIYKKLTLWAEIF